MNPRDRLLKMLKGHKADRVPLVLPGFEYPSREEIEAIDDPLRKEIAARILNQTTFRVTVPTGVNRLLVTPPRRIKTDRKKLPDGKVRIEGTIDTPLGDLTYINEWDAAAHTTWHVKYPVETPRDLEKLAAVPWEPPIQTNFPDPESLPEDFETRGIFQAGLSSPFVCVAGAMEYQKFLEMCVTDLDLVKEMTELCRRRVLDCTKLVLSLPGVHVVWLGGSEWVTPPMGSPRLYDALVQEHERSIIAYVHEHSEAAVHVHCHGCVRDAIPKVIDRGGDYTEPVEPPPDGDITMSEAKTLAAGRITLGGNVECRILANESEQVVEAATRAAFEGGKDRFVLRPTERSSPVLSQKEYHNYMRMIAVWEELSQIDGGLPGDKESACA